MSKEIFDFRTVAVSNNTVRLVPGMYNLTVRKAEYIKPDGKKPDGSAKTSFVEITFGGEMGIVGVKFYITPKAFERLQTIYTVWFDQTCDKVFDSTDAIGAFFEKAFSSEKAMKTYRRMIIGGKQAADGKIYAELPFSKYVVPDDAEYFKEGPFAVDSAQWIQHVKLLKPNLSTSTDDVMIAVGRSTKNDFSDDLPF